MRRSGAASQRHTWTRTAPRRWRRGAARERTRVAHGGSSGGAGSLMTCTCTTAAPPAPSVAVLSRVSSSSADSASVGGEVWMRRSGRRVGASSLKSPLPPPSSSALFSCDTARHASSSPAALHSLLPSPSHTPAATVEMAAADRPVFVAREVVDGVIPRTEAAEAPTTTTRRHAATLPQR
jgi:hypothetical protein